MNNTTPTDDCPDARTLEPENHRHAGYAPAGWKVYEEKNTKHIVFTHENADILCHVEADGIPTLVSVHYDDSVVTLSPESFQDGLQNAQALMSLCSLFVTGGSNKE